MGSQWHQLDHMQINCTSLETDNHASTSSVGSLEFNVPFQHKYSYIRDDSTSLLNFYMPDALSNAQPTVSNHWSQWEIIINHQLLPVIKSSFAIVCRSWRAAQSCAPCATRVLQANTNNFGINLDLMNHASSQFLTKVNTKPLQLAKWHRIKPAAKMLSFQSRDGKLI